MTLLMIAQHHATSMGPLEEGSFDYAFSFNIRLPEDMPLESKDAISFPKAAASERLHCFHRVSRHAKTDGR